MMAIHTKQKEKIGVIALFFFLHSNRNVTL